MVSSDLVVFSLFKLILSPGTPFSNNLVVPQVKTLRDILFYSILFTLAALGLQSKCWNLWSLLVYLLSLSLNC